MDFKSQYLSMIDQGLVVWSLDNEMSLKYRINNMLIRENWKLILDDYNDNQGVWQNHNNMWHEFIYLLLNKYGEQNFKSQLVEISKIEPPSYNSNIRSSIVTMMLRNIVTRDIMGEEIQQFCERYNMDYINESVIYCLMMALDNLYVYLHLLKGIKYDEFKSQISSSTIFKNNKIPKIIRLKQIMSEDMKDSMYSSDLTSFFSNQDVKECFEKLFPNLSSPTFNLLLFIDLFKIFALELVSDSDTPLNPIGWIKNKEKNISSRRIPLLNLGSNNVPKTGPFMQGLGIQWEFNISTENIRNEKSDVPNKDKFEYILCHSSKVEKLLNFKEPSHEKNIVLEPLRNFLTNCNINYERFFYFISILIKLSNPNLRMFIVWLFLRDNGYDISGNCMNPGECPEENLNFQTIMGDPGTLMTPLYYIWSILVGNQRNYRFDENDNIIYKSKDERKAEWAKRQVEKSEKAEFNKLRVVSKNFNENKNVETVYKKILKEQREKRKQREQRKLEQREKVILHPAVNQIIKNQSKNKKAKAQQRKENKQKKKEAKELNESEKLAFQTSSNGNSKESENLNKLYKKRNNNNVPNLNKIHD